jgi:aspartyl-tRNA(Asn)/glutamyl-tRNA(Gln) amidotransferase subunit B
VDYNRAGIPLLEIVTEPDINSPDEAYTFLQELRTLILYLGVSDCNMEEGSLRCDCNISLRKVGDEKLGTKIELKNMNTFKGVKQALEYEVHRQMMLLEDGKEIIQETRLWDQAKQITYSMRTKEEVHDYRYFPDPDLVVYEISQDLIDKLKAEIPELPSEKRRRFKEVYKLSDYDIEILTRDKALADYFEEVLKYYKNPKAACNFLTTDMMGAMNELNMSITNVKLPPENFARLLKLIDDGRISIKIAKEIIGELLKEGLDPEKYVEEKGLIQISDEAQLEAIVEQVIKENPKAVADFKSGKEKAITFLVGQVMRLTKGKANPGLVNKLLKQKLVGGG